jgi:hypothetical protein
VEKKKPTDNKLDHQSQYVPLHLEEYMMVLPKMVERYFFMLRGVVHVVQTARMLPTHL